MSNFGEQLREHRETHEKTLEQMSEATGIRRDFLEALEGDEIHVLPGPAFGKLYIRAYAEVLGFDPRPVIDAYDRDQSLKQTSASSARVEPSAPRRVEAAIARWRKARMAPGSQEPAVAVAEAEALGHVAAAPAAPEVVAEPAVAQVSAIHEEVDHLGVPPPPEEWTAEQDTAPIDTEVEQIAVPPLPRAPAPRRWLSRPWLLGILVVAVIAGVMLFRSGDGREVPPPVPSSSRPVEAPPLPKPAPAPQPAARAPLRKASAPAETAEPSRLSVSEFGLGRRVERQRLEGQDDHFRPGERVVFSTRVRGGRAGERLRHVWLYEGRVEQTIRLRLGGSSWRTHSTKTVLKTGAYAVEARDDAGQVLARATFVCAP